MDNAGTHDVKKRHLPSWMLGAAVSNQVIKENKDAKVGIINHGGLTSEPKLKTRSRKVVKKSLHVDEEIEVSEEVSAPKSKRRSRKNVQEGVDEVAEVRDSQEVYASKSERRLKTIEEGTLHEGEEGNADSSRILVKCGLMKRKRKVTSEAADSDVNSIANEKSSQKSDPRKKKNANTKKLTPKEALSSSTDSGGVLLMEDLISIAEEYVIAERHSKQQQPTIGACEPEEKHSAADASFNESACSVDVPPTECLSAVTEGKPTSATLSEQVHNNSIFGNNSRTGDAAQDMLNLLLGPLLMKSVEDSKKTSDNDDLLFDKPVQNQSQNRIGEALGPPLKKKSSLKDQVAMFLD